MSFSSNAPASTPSTVANASTPTSGPTSMALFNVEVESGNLAILIQYPDAWADYYLITEKDWSKVNRPIFATIKGQLDSTPPGSVAPLVISEKLKSYGVTEVEGLNVYEYLEGLRIRFVQKQDGAAMARELKRLSVRRELIEQLDGAKRDLVRNSNASFEDMTRTVERGLTAVTTEYYKEATPDLMSTLIDTIEKQGETPLKDGDQGFLSPFPSINVTLGPLSYPGSFTLVGARTGGSKSSLAWFYNTHVAEKNGVVCLHLDSSEMSEMELMQRSVCCLSRGRVPLWAITQQKWRENKEWTRIIRDECWPRVKTMMKTGVYYQNIGGMSPAEVMSFVRRFYYNKVGKGNHLLINLDYIKGTESFNSNSKVSEHQAVGNFVNDLKSLISNEIVASVFTSVQLNRTGISNGKKADEIVDSDASYSISDRIVQQATHGFIMRYKVPEEAAREGGDAFGNIKLLCVKKRRVVGQRGDEILRPVKLANGKFTDNYFNIHTQGFHFEDRGLLSEMLKVMGQAPVTMGNAGLRPAGL